MFCDESGTWNVWETLKHLLSTTSVDPGAATQTEFEFPMAMDNWSRNEYRTFITSRRDGVFEKREESAFSFKRPPSVEVSRGDYCEKEVYFDTDVNLPVHWETMVRVALKKNSSDFEFKSAPVSPVMPSVSTADELFHGCKMQPLNSCYSSQLTADQKTHPVLRKQQEEEGGRKNHTFVVSQRTVSVPFSQMSPGSLTRMFQPKYSKFCVDSTDIAPVETAMDSRSSSFRSQSSSTGESGDRDSGECTTSRDSNGSSQDASSVSNDTLSDHPDRNTSAVLKAKPKACNDSGTCPSNRRSLMSMSLDEDKAATSASWLSPHKWKGIFGGRKPPRSPKVDQRGHDQGRPNVKLSGVSCSNGSSTRTDTRNSYCDYPPRSGVRVSNHSYIENKSSLNTVRTFPAHPRHSGTRDGARSIHGVKADQWNAKFKHGAKVEASTSTNDSSSDVHSVVSTDRERDQGGILRVRERWVKYMKILKPPYGKAAASRGNDAIGKGESLCTSAKPRNSPQVTTAQEYVPARAKSMPAILKTPPLRPKSGPGALYHPPTNSSSSSSSCSASKPPPPPGASGKKCTGGTLLPHSGLVSSSPRLGLKSTSPKLTSKMSLSPKVKSSPKVNNTISPRMSSSSQSSITELHSAVQGAIAHCKQSHSGLLSPVPH